MNFFLQIFRNIFEYDFFKNVPLKWNGNKMKIVTISKMK